MVQRYDMGSIPYERDGIVEDEVGDYVKYEDYINLLEALKKIKKCAGCSVCSEERPNIPYCEEAIAKARGE